MWGVEDYRSVLFGFLFFFVFFVFLFFSSIKKKGRDLKRECETRQGKSRRGKTRQDEVRISITRMMTEGHAT